MMFIRTSVGEMRPLLLPTTFALWLYSIKVCTELRKNSKLYISGSEFDVLKRGPTNDEETPNEQRLRKTNNSFGLALIVVAS